MAAKRDPRRYVKVTTDMPGHKKLAGAPPATKWLAVTGIIVSGRDLSNGIIRAGVAVAEAEVPARHAMDLVKRGVWHEPGHDCSKCEQPPAGRVVVHDYLEHNSSSEEAAAGAAAMSSGGVKGNHTKWHVNRGVVDPDCPLCDSGTRSPTRSGLEIAPESHITSTSQDIPLTAVSQSQTDRITPDGLTRIRALTNGTGLHARRCADLVLAKAPGDVRNPDRYVIAAITGDPEAFRYKRGNPTKDTECPTHAGWWADACAGCAADRKAVS